MITLLTSSLYFDEIQLCSYTQINRQRFFLLCMLQFVALLQNIILIEINRKTMRRRTLQVSKENTQPVLRASKKYSYQSNIKLTSAGELFPRCRLNFDSAYSEVVAKTFLEDLLASLDSKFRKADQGHYFNTIFQTVAGMEQQLASMLDPISKDKTTEALKAFLEVEPKTAAAQVFCGGKTVLLEAATTNSKHPSIAFQTSKDEVRRKSKLSILSSFSSNRLIKLAKQQKLERKRSMYALQLQPEQMNDKYDNLIKQKVFKQTVLNMTTNLFRPNIEACDKKANKLNNLATVDEYSYDYDGSALPIKKFSRQCPDKVKILNPIYKVTHKDVLELRKARTSKYSFLQSSNQEGQPKVQAADVHQLNLGGKVSTREYMNELSCSQNREELDFQWKRKLQQMVQFKSIRIRQLKQV